MRTTSTTVWACAVAIVSLSLLAGCHDDDKNSPAITLPNRVAAGDATDTSVVLWSRSTRLGDVTFEYSTDQAFGTIDGTQIATVTDAMQPVKVSITGLTSATQYYYRAKDAVGNIATGQFRTSAAPGTSDLLRFGVSGDWRGDLAPFPALANAVGRDLDFFVAHGDTVYADVQSPDFPLDQAVTIDDFRIKHNEVYSKRNGLNALADLRASTSLLATIDDHEVTDDFSGGADPASDPRFAAYAGTYINETALFNNGLQAFQEYNPIEDLFYGTTGDARTANKRKLYRYRLHGLQAAVFLLDARSFRDPELPPVADPTDPVEVGTFLATSFTPGRTMLGAQQITDLKADLLAAQSAGITWKFVMVPEPMQNLGVVGASDRFEGYAAERTDLLSFIDTNVITNVVFVAADVHGTVVNNITYQTAPGQPQIPLDAFEITTGAVAFSQPFGPLVANVAFGFGIISQAELDAYNAMPRDQQDGFVQALIDGQITPLGYDPVGLAGSSINATLVQGGYVSVHTYGWTEFEIAPSTQVLTVTTYGIDWYSETDLAADPAGIAGRTPAVVSQFTVTPK